MARRPTKLQFYQHPVTCPYCRSKVVVVSVMEIILAARRHCPACKKEMFVENGRAKKMPKEVEQKTAKQVRSRISKPRA